MPLRYILCPTYLPYITTRPTPTLLPTRVTMPTHPPPATGTRGTAPPPPTPSTSLTTSWTRPPPVSGPGTLSRCWDPHPCQHSSDPPPLAPPLAPPLTWPPWTLRPGRCPPCWRPCRGRPRRLWTSPAEPPPPAPRIRWWSGPGRPRPLLSPPSCPPRSRQTRPRPPWLLLPAPCYPLSHFLPEKGGDLRWSVR